ncbi:MAG: hypothetical protein QOI22_2067 [Verrucomicrobiota bacterium]
MRKKPVSKSGLFNPRVLVAVLFCSAAAWLGFVSFAASPGSATITPSSATFTWDGTPVGGSAANETACVEGANCDTFLLTLAGTKTDWVGKKAHVAISWTDPAGVTDYDLYIHKGSPAGPIIGQSAGSDNPEQADINPNDGAVDVGTGIFYVHVVYFSAAATSQYKGEITILDAPPPPTLPPPIATPPSAAPGVPRYYNYAPGPGQGESSGEPSIGYNLTSHKAMFIAGLQTFRVTFPLTGACDATWEDVSYIVTKTKSLDPILFTDQITGRTFVSQLDSVVPPASPVLIGLNSFMAYTDDDGANWTPAQVNPPNGSYDHQSVGAGPYPSPVPAGINPTYQDAVYYCSQAGVTAFCARSDDGGLNFGPGTAIYNAQTDGCGGIHGHIKVAADGTVYVPNRGCNGVQSITVSEDAGTTWTVRHVEKTSGTGAFSAKAPPGILDPSVAIASDGTLYFSWISSEDDGGHAHVAVSHDKGVTWDHDTDLGTSYDLHNCVFIEAVAGDPNRAAVGFIGTNAPGNHEGDTFKGIWYAFIAHTYDGGATWTTVNATPNAPVQRAAGIWNEGGNSPLRNLLDFNEITMDEKGRVLYAYADGCTDDCESGGINSFSSKATIAKQSGGKGLLSAFDPAEPVVPQAACLDGRRDDLASYLNWRVPDNGGNDLTQYLIYRGTTSNNLALIGQTAGNKSSYNDRSADPKVPSYFYKIVAYNPVGAGAESNVIQLTVGPRLQPNGACVLPGVKVITDAQGDTQVGGQPQHDITAVSIAELKTDDVTGAADKIQFGIKVVNLTTVPSGFRWAVRFSVQGVVPPPDFQGAASEDFFVAMTSADGATPTFTWGVTSVFQGASRVFTTIGNLDPSSAYAADGTITLVIRKSDIGNPTPGQAISNILGSCRVTGASIPGFPNTGGTNETIMDSTGGGGYALRQANLCLPNAAPLAVLKATPETGLKPLTVHFDGSASSDPDAIDDIATYTFNFGDGGDDVPLDSPKVDHTYNNAGLYVARLVVTDSRGKVSSNTATRLIEVGRSYLANISGREFIGTVNDVAIGGFIIQQGGKHVLIRGLGPSLASAGITNALQDPLLELHNGSGALLISNNNWKATQQTEIQATGLAPTNNSESAILTFLPEGSYTAVLRGAGGTSGVGLIEIFDMAAADAGELANLSVRANVGTANDVLIAGVIVKGAVTQRVLLRGLGPSLQSAGISNYLHDPVLELHDANGALMETNDNWPASPNATAISATGLAPSDIKESAILRDVTPGAYTGIVSGVGNTTGIALAEIYKIN